MCSHRESRLTEGAQPAMPVPSLRRVLLALIIAPAVPGLSLILPPAIAFAAFFGYGVAWPFFAPQYFALRRQIPFTLGTSLLMGVAAWALAVTDELIVEHAIELRAMSIGSVLSFFMARFREWDSMLPFSAIGAAVFWLIVRDRSHPTRLSETFRGFIAPLGLRRFWMLILCYTILFGSHYYWTLRNVDLADRADDGSTRSDVHDADNGVTHLYERSNDDESSNSITLVVPLGFRYQSRTQRIGEWSYRTHDNVSLTTFYPDMSSPRDSANLAAGLYRCYGKATQCGGQFEVTIQNVARIERDGKRLTYADATADQISGYLARWRGGKISRAPQYGFDEEFNANGLIADKYFFERAHGRDSYRLVVECDTKSPVRFCKLYFSLGCDPRIGVKVEHWPYEKMQDAKDLHRRLEEFVTPMVKEPACQGKRTVEE
jgi:hypothetical protein